jgi:hypothetical protein
MQITNHFTPAHAGHGSRPDHAANASGRGHQFQPVAADVEPAAATDTTDAVAPTEETEGPRIPGKSVAHQARAHIAQFAELGGQSFGWLVSQIARGVFDAAAYAPDSEGTDGVDGSADGTDGVDVATASDGTEATGEEGDPAGDTTPNTAPEDTLPDIEEPADPVVDLIDTLLEDSEDDADVA